MKVWKFNILTNSELATIKNDAFFQGTGVYAKYYEGKTVLSHINLELLEATQQLLGALKRSQQSDYPSVWPWELCEKTEKIIARASRR